ncbi:hypothetical protein [Inquilinus sp. CA228]|uniref:hypothetical protein n=1 Tax=Inquilinus sp. CA228 TaxID=3455609 RepID=UPI003F8D24A0
MQAEFTPAHKKWLDVWTIMAECVEKALRASGYGFDAPPHYTGRSIIWSVSKDGKAQKVAVRTCRDGWFAFAKRPDGEWKTLSEVDLVAVAATDRKQNPRHVEIFLFPAKEVGKRLDQNVEARKAAGHKVDAAKGIWIGLERKGADSPTSAGSGLAEIHPAIGDYTIMKLPEESYSDNSNNEPAAASRFEELGSVGEVLQAARERIAVLANVPSDAVRLDLSIASR